VMSWASINSSLFTDSGTFTYLTATSDDLVLGSSSSTNPPFLFDVSASELDIFGTTNKMKLSYDASNYGFMATQNNGDIVFTSSNTAESTMVIGNGVAAQDVSVKFDEAVNDYYVGVDNTDAIFKIGAGTTVGNNLGLSVNSSGNVGIGTTDSSSGKLVVLGGAIISDDGTANAPSYAFKSNQNVGMYRAGPGILGFSTNGTEQMRINNSGNVGIGTTNPGALLDIGLAGTTLGTLRLEGNTSGYVQIQPAAAAGSWTMTLPPAASTTAGFQLTTAAIGGVTSWAGPASSRNIKNIDSLFGDPNIALNRILNTNIYNFHYKPGMGTGDSDTQYVGVMADEASWAMHFGGIVNPVNTLGYMVLGVQALNEKITTTNTNLEGLNLKTSQNITTIQELQDSIDTQLGVVQESLVSLSIQAANHAERLAKLETKMTDTESLIATIQAQIEELEASIATPVNIAQLDLNTQDISLLKQVLGITETSTPGDISILGKLTAEKTETGALIIKVTDKNMATIGRAVILAGETSVVIETKAVSEISRIFVTISSAEKAVPIKVGTITDGEDFVVNINDALVNDLKFNWWIVEED